MAGLSVTAVGQFHWIVTWAGVTISLPALPKDESARIRKREPQHNVPNGQKPQENKGIPEWGMFQVYGMSVPGRPYLAVSLGTAAVDHHRRAGFIRPGAAE
jgi:hypothetical protein